MDGKLKHLEFIQKIIDRQAKNSFLLKGWVITLIVALIALALKDQSFKNLLVVYSLIIIFWLLDSYYLWQEKLFRALYDHVCTLEEDEIDFNMNTKNFSNHSNCTWPDVFKSRTLLLFYFPLMIFTVVFFYLK